MPEIPKYPGPGPGPPPSPTCCCGTGDGTGVGGCWVQLCSAGSGQRGGSAAVARRGWAGRGPEPPSGRGGRDTGVGGGRDREEQRPLPSPGEWRLCLRANLLGVSTSRFTDRSLLAGGRHQAPSLTRTLRPEHVGESGRSLGRGEKTPRGAGAGLGSERSVGVGSEPCCTRTSGDVFQPARCPTWGGTALSG